MSDIRPFTRADLPAVGALLRDELVGPDRVAQRPVEDFLTATLLDGPWADRELPSLVATRDDGTVVGFVAIHARRMRLADQPIKVACFSHLAVAEGDRGGAAGALLLRRGLAGPQDVTISDTAIEVVARVWHLLGGSVDVGRSCEWMHVLRPGALGARLVRRRLTRRRPWVPRPRRSGRQPVAASHTPVPGLPLHVAAGVIPALRPAAPEHDITTDPFDAAEAAAELPRLARRYGLRPDYDEGYLSWLLDQIRLANGELVHRMVRRHGRLIGWYVYQLRTDTGRARVLQVVCALRDGDAVVDALFQDAIQRGATVLSGRLEPHLREPLRKRLTLIGFGARHVVSTKNVAIRASLLGDGALVTLLDGEWW